MRRVVLSCTKSACCESCLSLIQEIACVRQARCSQQEGYWRPLQQARDGPCLTVEQQLQLFWPLHHTSDPNSATELTAETTTRRIRLMDRPPFLLLRLATACKAPLALVSRFSKCVLKDSFGSIQKPSHLVAPWLMGTSALLADACLLRNSEYLRLLAERQ